MIGEDDGSVALGNTSHCHMKNAMWSLNVMLLQPKRKIKSVTYICLRQRSLLSHLKDNSGFMLQICNNTVIVSKVGRSSAPELQDGPKTIRKKDREYSDDLFLHNDEPDHCTLFLSV